MNLTCRACNNPMNPTYERVNGFLKCKYVCGCAVCEPAYGELVCTSNNLDNEFQTSIEGSESASPSNWDKQNKEMEELIIEESFKRLNEHNNSHKGKF